MVYTKLRTLAVLVTLAAGIRRTAAAQSGHVHPPANKPQTDSAQMASMADHAMSGAMSENMKKHMEMTPSRTPTHADSVRARRVAEELKRAIAKYRDTTVAVADGYRMFLPNLKEQRVFHFTNNGRAVLEAFRFDPTKPTSLLYKRGANGKLELTGAMYTSPKRASLTRLNDRVPLSIAQWHKHVNWCLPDKGDEARWLQRRNAAPIFGPEGTVATKAECDAVKGNFHETIFGWMLHANVYESDDLGGIFGDDHHPPPKR